VIHVVKQLPAILLWESRGYSTSEDNIEIPVVGCEFFGFLVNHHVAANILVNLTLGVNIYQFVSISTFVDAFALIQVNAQSPRQFIEYSFY
jgi:hypothetical protein